MSWLFSRALVEEYSAGTCSDGGRYALSSGSTTPQAFLPSDRMTAFSRPSRFGMTFGPLTESLGAELLTWFLAGFRARTSAQPEKVQDSTASDQGYGAKWRELLVRYDRDTCSWRTHRSLWDEDLSACSLTLPKWGSMRDGVLLEQDTSADGIFGSAAGSWLPTLGKNEYRGSGKERFRGSDEYRGAKMSEGLRTCKEDPIYLTPSFGEYAMGWPLTWTELAPLATDRFRSWRQQHGGF